MSSSRAQRKRWKLSVRNLLSWIYKCWRKHPLPVVFWVGKEYSENQHPQKGSWQLAIHVLFPYTCQTPLFCLCREKCVEMFYWHKLVITLYILFFNPSSFFFLNLRTKAPKWTNPEISFVVGSCIELFGEVENGPGLLEERNSGLHS